MLNPNLEVGYDAYVKGNYDAAIQLLSGSQSSGDHELSRRHLLAQAYHRKSMLVEASEHYKSVLQLDSKHVLALANLALIADERSDPITAQAYFYQLFELDPQNPEWPYRFGCMIHRGVQYTTQLSLPISCFSRAVYLDPLHHGALEMRALCHYQNNDHAAAEEDLFHLLYVAPGWRDEIQPAMQDVMENIWDTNRTEEILEEAGAAPVPQAMLSPELKAMQQHLDIVRQQMSRHTFGLNASLMKESDERRAYLVVAEQERGEGLAGCSIEEYTLGKWVASVPSPLMQWFVLFMRLVDRPLPDGESLDRKDDIRRYWRRRGLNLEEFADEVDVVLNKDAFDVDGEAWPDDLLAFLKDHGRRLFKAIVDPKSSENERSEAILEVARKLPGNLPHSNVRSGRLAEATTYANLFVALHELTHVFSKHRDLEAEYLTVPEGPRAWRWQSEIHADRHAAVSLLRETYNPEEAVNDSVISLFFALGMVMTTIGLQQRMDPESDAKLHYPPVLLRMLGIEAAVCEMKEYQASWEVLMLHFAASAIAVGEACDWPEFVATVRELFLNEPSSADLEEVAAHQMAFVQKSVSIGGRPIILGPQPDAL